LRRQIKPEDPVNSILKVGDLEIDPLNHQVRRQGKTIELTAKEFSLLEYMARNSGQSLTREQIIDKVWEFDFDATSNVVDIYIHYLRSKIDQPFPRKLIKTVRGIGYTLRAD
jgi:DNA-binding response OmpR family regulator